MPTGPVPTPDLVERLRREVRGLLCDAGPVAFDAVLDDLRPVWEHRLPADGWVAAALADEPLLRRLPDGRWVHLPSAVDGRCFTTAVDAAAASNGVVSTGDELHALLWRYRGWGRIPIASDGRRGMAELLMGHSGRPLLVIPRDLMPPMPDRGSDGARPDGLGRDGTGGLLALRPGPEGLSVSPATIDEVATQRFSQALRQVAAVRTHDGPDDRWTWPDLELAVLAADPSQRTSPTAPLARCVRGAVPGAPAVVA